ncbi:hypothetical protein DFH06DRAFT_1422604 [Mycena polygramma]|nr:hypothetical protein DFH06DRAFT_1422604 [Mycena polygramma]
MFFRFYDHPGRRLPPAKQTELRNELLEVAQTALNPVPDYQCLSARPGALDDKLIVVAYAGTEAGPGKESDKLNLTERPRAVAFTSALYLDVPEVDHPVLHTGLTVAVPSLQRTGILAQLFVQLFQHVVPLHPRGMWVTTLAAVLSSLVQSEKALENTYPCPPSRKNSTGRQREHLAIARAIDERYRAPLLISPAAIWDEESFVFRGSMDWEAAETFKKDVDDARFWHRDQAANEFFRGLMRPGSGDEVLLVGFMDAERLRKEIEQWRHAKLEARL